MTSVCIDARWLDGGIGTYTLNLVRELASLDDVKLAGLTLPRHAAVLGKICSDLRLVGSPMYSLREQFEIAHATRRAPLLHVPHYNAPLAYNGTLLVTVHDLTHIVESRFRRSWKSWGYAQPMLRLVTRKAAHIFTVSEYSKRQIIERLGVSGDRITVVPNGVAAHFYPELRSEAGERLERACEISGPYILYVGNFKPHKNLGNLLRAFATLVGTASFSCSLVLAGEDPIHEPELRRLAGKLGLNNSVRFLGHISDDLLRAAYSAAKLTVLPSFEEGFGLPVLESMACGTPVACSRAAALPETGGQAAVYFDPRDVDSIAAAMRLLLESPTDWEWYRQSGLKRAQCFTWADCAVRHLQVYRRYGPLPSRAEDDLPAEVLTKS